MNDRYLARGKNVNTGEWHVGYYVPHGEIATLVQPVGVDTQPICNEGWANAWTVDPATLGQCTGLKDRNGTLIFEGDILQFSNRAEWYRTDLLWKNAEDELQDLEKYPYERRVVKLPESYTWMLWDELKEYWEIIGNIHEPEVTE